VKNLHTFSLDLDLDPELDPDPHSSTRLDPDPHIMYADPKHLRYRYPVMLVFFFFESVFDGHLR
jgi:hypothetical protein